MIRLLIVSDIRLYREGLMQVLAREDRVTVVDAVPDLDAIRLRIRELTIDIVLLDMAMGHGVEIAQDVVSLAPNIKVVALGVREIEEEILASIEMGAMGYVPRDASIEDLLDTLESTARGDLRCSPRIAGELLRRFAVLAAGARSAGRALRSLTAREREIILLIDRGLSNKEIAQRLGVEVATVKNHVHNLLEKLSVHRRSEAAARMRGRTYESKAAPPL